MRYSILIFVVFVMVQACKRDELSIRDYKGTGNAVCDYSFNGVSYLDSVGFGFFNSIRTINFGADSIFYDTLQLLYFGERFVHVDGNMYSFSFKNFNISSDTIFLESVNSQRLPYVRVSRYDDLSDPDAPCGGFSPHHSFLADNYLLFDHFDTETGDFEIRFKTYLLEPSDCMGNEHIIELEGTVVGRMEL